MNHSLIILTIYFIFCVRACVYVCTYVFNSNFSYLVRDFFIVWVLKSGIELNFYSHLYLSSFMLLLNLDYLSPLSSLIDISLILDILFMSSTSAMKTQISTVLLSIGNWKCCTLLHSSRWWTNQYCKR